MGKCGRCCIYSRIDYDTDSIICPFYESEAEEELSCVKNKILLEKEGE